MLKLLLTLCSNGLEVQGMSQKTPPTEEESRNNRFSFIVGIVIALVILIIFVLLFR